jgi:peptidoglycan/LPS O-acetylase OafA/YrhL
MTVDPLRGSNATDVSVTDRGTRNLGLDVVRAVAVSMVLITHWGAVISWWIGLQWPRIIALSGFFGVELFFALSGFLIGLLLLELIERDASAHGWWRFMMRRWLRTLPLYGLCLAGLAIFWRPAGNLLAYLAHYGTLTQNLLWSMPDDNWFGVSWSLSVEEWFYLLFSVLLVGSVALTGQRTLHLDSCSPCFLSSCDVRYQTRRCGIPTFTRLRYCASMRSRTG